MKTTVNKQIELRTAEEKDFEDILRLNEESVHFLSPLTRGKLEGLNSRAELHMVVIYEDRPAAFMIAFKEGSSYESINYRWFLDRYPVFLYIDRVVVDKKRQAEGLGRLLYEEAFRHARSIGAPYLAAEIDVAPPNPVSLKFHKGFGFYEVGRQEVNGEKIVSMQMAKT
jgi:predicted GNAT superfamily acetyltransferase